MRNIARLWRVLHKIMRKGLVIGFFDTETTGLDENAKIIQFSCCLYEAQEDWSLKKLGDMDTYINPEEPLSEKIQSITGIDDFTLSHYENESYYADEIFNYLNQADLLIAHNAPFDVRMLKQMCDRLSLNRKIPLCLDSLVMARDVIPPGATENYKLESIVSYLLPDSEFRFHSSLEDVNAMAGFVEKCLAFYRDYQLPTNKTKVVLEWASIWINPNKKSMVRIKVNIDRDKERYGWIFYDCIRHQWDAVSKKAAKQLLEEIDLSNLEDQVMYKYAWKYNAPNIDALASAWSKDKRNAFKETS